MSLSTGSRLGPYEIQSALGAGGMGEVYRARDTRLERTVAIKVLNSALVASADLKARFEREAKTVSQLNHPNICVLHDLGHEGETDYLVMEYLEGESLAQRLQRGPLSLPELVKIGSEIADALDRAHRAGIVHRDLKPGNVMLTPKAAKLLDFGLAKPAVMGAAASGSAPFLSAAATLTSPSPHGSPLTQEGAVVGTVQYMSPEQIKGIEADARSDIFAFGAVLYEMATGKRAFQGKSQIKVASAILEDEPQSVSAVTQTAPAALDRLIRTCLAKEPDERFQSALDVKLELKWIGDAARQPQMSEKVPDLKRALPWIGGVAAVVFVVAIVSWFALQPKPIVRDVTKFNLDLGKLQFGGRSGSRIAISPDGRTIVMVLVDEAGKLALYTRNLDSVAVTALPGTEGAAEPFFSPDSRWVAFSANSKLMKVPINGGVPVTICDLPTPTVAAAWGDNHTIAIQTLQRSVSLVSDDGGIPTELDWAAKKGYTWLEFLPGSHGLLAAARREGTFYIDLLRMDSHTTETVVQGGSWPRYLSGGYLVYAQFDSTDAVRGFTGGLLAVPFDVAKMKRTGAPVPVLQNVVVGWGGAAYYDIAQNGTAVYAPSPGRALSDVNELVWTDRTGKTTPVGAPPRPFVGIRLSPDGSRAAFEIAEGNPHIYTFDFKHKAFQRLTFDDLSVTPIFTPDGTRIIYTDSAQSGTIWSTPADGSGQPVVVLKSQFALNPNSVSPDGSSLAYTESRPSTHHDIYLMSLREDPAPRPLVNTRFDEKDAQISPDGKFFAYVSDESGTDEVFVQSLSGRGGKWPISNGPGVVPRWSRDGKDLFYVSQGKVMSVAVSTKNGFSADNPKFVFDSRALNRNGYDVAPDGRFLWARPLDSQQQNVVGVIENFDVEVRQRSGPAQQQ